MRTSTDTDYIYYITTRTEKLNPTHVYVVIKRIKCSDITQVMVNSDVMKIFVNKSTYINVSARMAYFDMHEAMKVATTMQKLLSVTMFPTGRPECKIECEIVIEDVK